MKFSQGYKPEPKRQGPLAILLNLIVTCLGVAGIVWLALGWIGKFV